MPIAEAASKVDIGARREYSSTGCAVPITICNGPITNEIRLNNGVHLWGPMVKAPAGQIIARAVWLAWQNVGSQLPGEGTVGVYGRYRPGACFAEAEGGLPQGWKTFAEEYFDRPKGTNSVTRGTGGDIVSLDVRGAYNDPVLDSIIEPIENSGLAFKRVSPEVPGDSSGSQKLVLITPLCCRFYDKYGWDKLALMEDYASNSWYCFEEIRHMNSTKRAFADEGLDINSIDPLTHFACYTDPTRLMIVCTGLDHMRGQTMSFTPRGNYEVIKPSNWNQLLADALEDLGPMPPTGPYSNEFI
jgi:hypothetical protein